MDMHMQHPLSRSYEAFFSIFNRKDRTRIRRMEASETAITREEWVEKCSRDRINYFELKRVPF